MLFEYVHNLGWPVKKLYFLDIGAWELEPRSLDTSAFKTEFLCCGTKMLYRVDSKIFPLLSLFICARCFNPFDEGQYDINWAGPITLREDQVTPVSVKMCSTTVLKESQ